MKILITGAKGQVGSALRRCAELFPFEIIATNSKELDIANKNQLIEFIDKQQPDVLINAAAYTAVDLAETEADSAYSVNAQGVLNLAEMAKYLDIPLIHISTDYVFDGKSSKAYKEDDATAPLGIYGKTKLEGEILAAKVLKKLIILRTSGVFGLEGNNFPKTMIRLASERDEIGIVADQAGCPTFADDIARAILALVEQYNEQKKLPWGVYHYTGADSCSWYEFAVYILDLALSEGVIDQKPQMKALDSSEYPTAAERPKNSVLNCQKIVDNFQQISLNEWKKGVNELINLSK